MNNKGSLLKSKMKHHMLLRKGHRIFVLKVKRRWSSVRTVVPIAVMTSQLGQLSPSRVPWAAVTANSSLQPNIALQWLPFAILYILMWDFRKQCKAFTGFCYRGVSFALFRSTYQPVRKTDTDVIDSKSEAISTYLSMRSIQENTEVNCVKEATHLSRHGAI